MILCLFILFIGSSMIFNVQHKKRFSSLIAVSALSCSSLSLAAFTSRLAFFFIGYPHIIKHPNNFFTSSSMNSEDATVCTLLCTHFITPTFILQGWSKSCHKYLSCTRELDVLFSSKILSLLITSKSGKKYSMFYFLTLAKFQNVTENPVTNSKLITSLNHKVLFLDNLEIWLCTINV